MKDLYSILNLTPSASSIEIRKSYRTLALKYHPDRNRDNEDYRKFFIEINEAYHILSNSELKKKYDLKYFTQKNKVVTPEIFLNKFIEIRKFLNSKNRNKISKKALYSALQKLLDNRNLHYLHTNCSQNIKEQIIKEVLACLKYLSSNDKLNIIKQLIILADSKSNLIDIIHSYIKSMNRNINLMNVLINIKKQIDQFLNKS